MKKQLRPVIFGEVLYDCFPDGRQVLGGAPFNVAWNLKAFGLDPYFISCVGNDELGKQIIAAMHEWGMDAEGVQIDKAHPTGTVEVKIENSEPHYEIVNHRAWDYIEYQSQESAIQDGVLYHGSLALRNKTSRATLQKIKKVFSFPMFIDVNLRPPWWDGSFVLETLKESEIVKINEEELSLIIPYENTMELRIQHLLENTDIETLIVTCGSEGAIAALSNGERYQVKPEKATQFVDTVGAGDAFSSVVLLGMIHDWPLALTMERAQQFASQVVGIQGATTRDKKFYESFNKLWN